MATVCKKVVKVNVSPWINTVVHQPQSRRFVDQLAHFPRLSSHPLRAAIRNIFPDNCVVNKEFHSLMWRSFTTTWDQKAYNCFTNQELRGGQWTLGSVSLDGSSFIFGCWSVFKGSDPIIPPVVWCSRWRSYVWIIAVGWLVSESIAALGPVLKGLAAFFKGEYRKHTTYNFWQVEIWGVLRISEQI